MSQAKISLEESVTNQSLVYLNYICLVSLKTAFFLFRMVYIKELLQYMVHLKALKTLLIQFFLSTTSVTSESMTGKHKLKKKSKITNTN